MVGGSGENEWLSSSERNKNFIAKYKDEGCPVGLFGWRRKCLFLVLTILLLFVLLNLALTLWILKVMEFSSSGLGPLKIMSGGIQLRGDAFVYDKLVASKIRSRKSEALLIESSKNISLNTRSTSGRLLSRLALGDGKVDCQASSMRISDTHGKLLFSADNREVLVGAESLVVTGEGGAVFHGSVQTPKVKADSGHELRLESATRSINILGTFGVTLLSGAGDISATCLSDLKLESQSGSIRIEAPNIYLPNLQTSTPSTTKNPISGANIQNIRGQSQIHAPVVYQVCICQKGRLFLAPPESDCVADNDVCR